jgi:hypothetical protein
MLLKPNNSNTSTHDNCGICKKRIYKHNVAIPCHLDGKLYHAKCLKIDSSTALEVQQYGSWYCPICLEDVLPFFKDTSNTYNTPLKTCHCCSKFISQSRHSIISCSICENVVHSKCAKEYICDSCCADANIPLASPHFNIFDPGEVSDYQMFDHDFELDDHLETLSTASALLERCDYIDVPKFDCDFSSLSASPSHLSFYFLNIDGFKTNFDEFTVIHSSLVNTFDIICFAETNVDSSDLKKFTLGHEYLCLDIPKLNDKQKGSGIAVFYRKSLKLSLVEGLCNYGTNARFQILGGKLKTEHGYLHFLVVYRFHSCPVNEFCSELESLVSSIDGPCIILGDFNINCFSFSASDNLQTVDGDDTQLYVNSLLGNGYSPLISKGTRYDNRRNKTVTCIDQIWYNMLSSNIRSGVFSSSVSDHLPIFSFIPVTVSAISSSDPNTIPKIKYAITPATLETLSNTIPKIVSDTYSFSETNSASDTYSFFHRSLSVAHDACLIDKKSKTSARCLDDNPWISVGLAKSSNVKNILYKRWIRSKGTSLEESKGISVEETRYNEYRDYRSKLRDLIKASKTNYYMQLFEKVNGDARRTWSVVNKIRCKMKGSSSPSYIEFNQQLITDRRSICTLFNNYFTEVANKLNSDKYKDDPPSPDDFRRFLGKRSCNSILLYQIEPDEIIKIISSFNNNKSSDLSVRAIKHVRHALAPVLTRLFNNCMFSGVFPSELKIAKVIPLFKNGKQHLLSNYRPISILPLFSKIFERIIHSRLTSFFDSQNTIYENQFGFRKKHSTIHALSTAVKSIAQSMNDKSHSIGLFIDFSKAFDTIKHEILLKKLEHYGIRGPALDLLTDYLSGRYQYVSLDGSISDLQLISIGVPQGSVLGPLLFIVYINDIINCVSDHEHCSQSVFVLFADDTNVFIRASSISDAQLIAESTLQCISKYLFANYLHINIKKTKYVVFSPSAKNPPPCKIVLESTILERVRSIKFLGIIIDEQLNWVKQTNSLICKLSKTCSTLRDLSCCLPKSLRPPVFNALVNSHISYGITVWGGNSVNLEKVFRTQKKCIRSLFKIPCRRKVKGSYIYGHTKHLFTGNSLLTAHNLYNYSMISDAFKVIVSKAPVSYFETCYQVSSVNPSRLISSTCTLSSLSSNFHHMIPLLWNGFLAVNKITKFSLCGFKSFKRSLKSFIVSMQSSFEPDEWHKFNNNLIDYCNYLKFQCLELPSNQPRVRH